MNQMTGMDILNRIDFNKPYCGNCGAQDVPLKRLHNGSDDDQHVCKDRKACAIRIDQNQKELDKSTGKR
jgi:hypothetical protein